MESQALDAASLDAATGGEEVPDSGRAAWTGTLGLGGRAALSADDAAAAAGEERGAVSAAWAGVAQSRP
jgi:hypothetical protein